MQHQDSLQFGVAFPAYQVASVSHAIKYSKSSQHAQCYHYKQGCSLGLSALSSRLEMFKAFPSKRRLNSESGLQV